MNNNWEEWWFNDDGTIESRHCPGMTVGIAGNTCDNQVSIVLTAKNSDDDRQRWTLRPDNVIVNTSCSTKAIDYDRQNSNIIIWDTHGEGNQVWELNSA